MTSIIALNAILVYYLEMNGDSLESAAMPVILGQSPQNYEEEAIWTGL